MLVRRLADDLASGADDSSRIGGGIEYAQSRPYQPGDSLRRLDWRLTARRQRPYSREYEALKRVPLFLVIDTSASMRAKSGPCSKFDAALWIAAAFGLVALRRMNPVAVIDASAARAARASLSRDALLTGLDRTRASASVGPASLAPALARVRLASRVTSLVLVLSDFQDAQDIDAMSAVAARHDVAALHLVDPFESRVQGVGFLDAREAESHRSFVAGSFSGWADADAVRARCVSRRIDYARLQVNGPIVPSLRRVLSRRDGLTTGARA
jgi:uncharacterized protein (DUF58 family)